MSRAVSHSRLSAGVPQLIVRGPLARCAQTPLTSCHRFRVLGRMRRHAKSHARLPPIATEEFKSCASVVFQHWPVTTSRHSSARLSFIVSRTSRSSERPLSLPFLIHRCWAVVAQLFVGPLSEFRHGMRSSQDFQTWIDLGFMEVTPELPTDIRYQRSRDSITKEGRSSGVSSLVVFTPSEFARLIVPAKDEFSFSCSAETTRTPSAVQQVARANSRCVRLLSLTDGGRLSLSFALDSLGDTKRTVSDVRL